MRLLFWVTSVSILQSFFRELLLTISLQCVFNTVCTVIDVKAEERPW